MQINENFTIKGIHCKSCKTLIETELNALNGVHLINVDYINENASIEYDSTKINLDKIFKAISDLNYTPLKHTNPQLSTKKNNKNSKPQGLSSFWLGLLIPFCILVVMGGYYYVTQSGGLQIISKLNTDEASLGIILLIGILTGFHCIGMCGGFVISYTTKNAINKQNSIKRHLEYNAGRLISYSIIGGILGGAGSFFGINPNFSGAMLLIAGTLMFVMGMAFTTGYPIFEALRLKTPQIIARYLYSQKHSNKPKGPFTVGLLNGFMPCGPLQAMQLYALSTGSIYQGMLVMAVYTVGTIPMMLGFGVFISKLSQNSIHKVVKFSGALIIILGLIMFNRGLINFGLGYNVLQTSNNNESQPINNYQNKQEFQTIEMNLGYYGYEPNTLYIKRGIPVRWVINVTALTGCTNAIMIESLGIKQNLVKGENIIEFTPPDNVNQFDFSCWMRMVWGKFVIKD